MKTVNDLVKRLLSLDHNAFFSSGVSFEHQIPLEAVENYKLKPTEEIHCTVNAMTGLSSVERKKEFSFLSSKYDDVVHDSTPVLLGSSMYSPTKGFYPNQIIALNVIRDRNTNRPSYGFTKNTYSIFLEEEAVFVCVEESDLEKLKFVTEAPMAVSTVSCYQGSRIVVLRYCIESMKVALEGAGTPTDPFELSMVANLSNLLAQYWADNGFYCYAHALAGILRLGFSENGSYRLNPEYLLTPFGALNQLILTRIKEGIIDPSLFGVSMDKGASV